MKNLRFKPYHSNKDTQTNRERKLRLWGISKDDLTFFTKNNYTPINKATLMTGVLVGFRPTSKDTIFFAPWLLQTCYHSQDDQRHISELINHSLSLPEPLAYDYFIMDGFGNILFSNCEISKKINENGVIHLTSQENKLNHLVYPATTKKFGYKNYYCCGETFDDLNRHIKLLIDRKIISTPKNFQKGFSETEECQLS